MDVLIPCALAEAPAAAAALERLDLPNLRALAALLQPTHLPALPEDSPLPIDEVLQAQALGLAPQAPPWAALRAHTLGLPGAAREGWAFVHLTHWEVGSAHVTLHDPQALRLTAEEAQTLRAAMQPYFAEDGLTLHPDEPARWLVQGEALRTLRCASLARVIGRDLAPWLPDAPWLRRLQTEMQMLLYTHPLADARAQRRAPAVNGIWIDAAGALAQVPARAKAVELLPDLAPAARAQDWAAWARAWSALDARLAPLRQAAQDGLPVTLTLCGELQALRLGPARRRWWTRLRSPRLSGILQAP
jgi:hypothetical protein